MNFLDTIELLIELLITFVHSSHYMVWQQAQIMLFKQRSTPEKISPSTAKVKANVVKKDAAWANLVVSPLKNRSVFSIYCSP